MEQLDSDIFTNDTQYYFSFLTDRFIEITNRWTQALTNKFHRPFKPIFLLPYIHNHLFTEDNYIVINERLFKKQEQYGRKDIIELLYPEDMNKQFSASSFVNEVIDKLKKKQENVYVLPFTSACLTIHDPNVIILGPLPEVAAKFDDKVEHIRTFQHLNIKMNEVEVHSSIEKLKENQKTFPFFFSAAFSSGGFESHVIHTRAELDLFYKKLRPLNAKGPFIAAKLLEHIVNAPNVSAIVTSENQTQIICISDQILRENCYMGNLYPTAASPLHQDMMKKISITIGNYMSTFGFRGLFGIDFLITQDGSCYPTDINPRRQGGYFMNVLMSKTVDIIDMELSIALDEPITSFNSEDIYANYSWAHHKLAPYYHNVEILEEFEEGSPTDPFTTIGSVYRAQYYPKNHVLLSGNPGFYAASGYDKKQLKHAVETDVDRIISTKFMRRPDIDVITQEPIEQNPPVSEIFIQPLHPSEIEAASLILQQHIKDPGGIAWDEIHAIEQYMKGKTDENGRKRFYLTAHDSAGQILGIIGYCSSPSKIISLCNLPKDQTGEIVNMFVSSSAYHGGGIGKKLFNTACHALKNENKIYAVLDCGIRYKENWNFFEHIGCTSCGIIPNKYGPGWHTKVFKITL